MTHPEDIDLRLARLARATEGVHPSAGFSMKVMRSLNAEAEPSLFDWVWASARRWLPVATVAAVLAVSWAVHVDRSVDDEIATTYASVGFE